IPQVAVNMFPCFLSRTSVHTSQSNPVSVQILKLGESTAIECYIESLMNKRMWYKLNTDRRLQLVAFFDTTYNRSEISDKFRQRFSVQFDNINSHLSIFRVAAEDVGTYFCGALFLNDIRFGPGTSLTLKEKIIEKYKSGDGYRRISRALNIPGQTVLTN
uniref:Ig-like domain-containing protein n=1 Tax=Kryptolebias marmoratus TaxID=37003 RepID=A0A3Q3B1S8_KRYMA